MLTAVCIPPAAMSDEDLHADIASIDAYIASYPIQADPSRVEMAEAHQDELLCELNYRQLLKRPDSRTLALSSDGHIHALGAPSSAA